MTDHTWDDDDPAEERFSSELDALGFDDDRHSHDDHDDWSGLDAFTVDESPIETLSAPTSAGPTPTVPSHDDSDDTSGPVTFGVTNPAGTITAQATISGAINRIELASATASMTESDLARDIMTTAKLANIQGRAIQRAMVQGLLMYQGMDQHVAEQFIDDISDLPTPAQSEAAQAEAMAAYLRDEH
ncbi:MULTISPECIES: hypothetical protein [unclassified Mycolicibacterium]|uniref:hypothetical protein n=1 Tax=unclassified Mycolicibacterium TaxID=2636767 RepID=UPI0012DF1D6C|nr:MULTISPECIES: hypothetical protein [unclassified Mycolicibacterium]MUL83669.1 hypothetical protein [Mycolicibacterium sp. CBMA 329]MUL90660.1 hypothetical protein [Mycolicibacterium sp. CBMA 331]MUM00629.1 hypothetical protein [Mycolicibacterium sp. CBMA 334]MUM28388.1 hypothetical protein [Mycolicibacterium sp. CBMA 295]MUM41604.1 hypothetical protein [Mycolicibacterium sp. CBMA 247]